MFNSAKFENIINQIIKKIAKIIPPEEEKKLNYFKKIQEKFDLKNVSQTLNDETEILKSIKDDVHLSTVEYPHSNAILSAILESLFNKENSLCFLFEEIVMNKGLDVSFY